MFEESKGQPEESGGSIIAGVVAFCLIMGAVAYIATKFAHWVVVTAKDVSHLATSF